MIKTEHLATIVFLLWCVFGIWLLTPACKLLPTESAQLIQKTDRYYTIVKTIVTDPAIYDTLTPEQRADIHEVDASYKKIRKITTTLAESQSVVRTMAQCAIDICDILDELNVDDDEKKREIAALRIALKIFMATLVEPPLELVE